MKLYRVTITGADDSNEPSDLAALAERFPFVEFAILASKTRSGKEDRYPSNEWIERFIANMSWPLSMAVHLCGEYCRDAVNGSFTWAITRNSQFRAFDRIQLNGAAAMPSTADKLSKLADATGKEFILPVRSMKVFTSGYLFPNRPGVSYLIDSSGGFGIPIEEFEAPPAGAKIGYAGGLGPANIREVLGKLTALPSDAEFWVCMETNVRSVLGMHSVLDLRKVRTVLEIAAEFVGVAK